jgi:hypothetical protein
MPAREKDRRVQATPGRDTQGCPSITAWLESVRESLAGSRVEADSILNELEEHVISRSRDLMLEGLSSANAESQAIAEFGTIADLATRFHAVRTRHRRRIIVNTAAITLATAVVLTGISAFTPRFAPVPTSTFETVQPESAPQLSTARISSTPETPWADFFESAGKAANMPVFVDWPSIRAVTQGGGVLIDIDNPTALSFPSFTINRALQFANHHYNLFDNVIDYRVLDGTLVFSTTRTFDSHEIELTTYDMTPIIEERRAASADEIVPAEVVGEIKALILDLVFPEQWTDNGGDLARATVYGTKLFIQAPRRVHPKIQWVINEARGGYKPRSAIDSTTSVESLRLASMNTTSVSAQWLLLATRALSDNSTTPSTDTYRVPDSDSE